MTTATRKRNHLGQGQFWKLCTWLVERKAQHIREQPTFVEVARRANEAFPGFKVSVANVRSAVEACRAGWELQPVDRATFKALVGLTLRLADKLKLPMDQVPAELHDWAEQVLTPTEEKQQLLLVP